MVTKPRSTSSSTSTQRRFKHPVQGPQDYMHTRSKSGIVVPKKHFNLSATVDVSPIPTNYGTTLKDPHWFDTMREESNALMKQNTWNLVPRPTGVNVMSGKWIYCHKYNTDDLLSRYKARWVLQGFTQQHGVDYGETFSPVIKPATIHLVLGIASSKAWSINQLDVKNTFLHGNLSESVYAQQPSRFVSASHLNSVCKLNKSLYGLKQAPRTWFLQFTAFLATLGFRGSKSDTSLFILCHGSSTIYLLMYVDGIILTASSTSILHHLINKLKSEFSMSDLRPCNTFLTYPCIALQLVSFYPKNNMHQTCSNVATCKIAIPPISLAGCILFSPTELHLSLVKHILRYIKDTIPHDLTIS
jgi:hypothetical protein